MSILKSNNDPIAMKHIRKLQGELDMRGMSQRQFGRILGCSVSLSGGESS